ncbi:MAG TPA: diguanylate cyclase [Baekduia sp.]|nr:diguanylate cyclase [Baekduia sp.]
MTSANGRRRSRPVADLPIAALRDGAEPAKRWLLELVDVVSLDAAASIPVAEFAAGAPRLCAAAIAALESDSLLTELSGSPLAADVRRLTGATDPGAVATAVQALRVALWSSLRASVLEPSADLVNALSERLAEISAEILTTALTGDPAPAPVRAAPPVTAAPPAPPAAHAASVPQAPHVVSEPAADSPITVSKPDVTPWRTAIARRLERGRGEEPFSVLTVEIDDVDRLVASASSEAVAAAIDAAERAMISGLGPADVLVREHVGRYWIVSPINEHRNARALGEQLAASVSGARIDGSALTASVGVALYPRDGSDPEALCSHADEGLYAARAAGIRIA